MLSLEKTLAPLANLRVMIDIEEPTDLARHYFTYRGSSHRCKGAAGHIIDMVWLYRSVIPVGRRGIIFLFKMISTCLRGTKRGGFAPSGQNPYWSISFLASLEGGGTNSNYSQKGVAFLVPYR